jgi:hypothetical protein
MRPEDAIQDLYDTIILAREALEAALPGHPHAASLRRLLDDAEDADTWVAEAAEAADDPFAEPFGLLKVQDLTLLKLNALHERLILAVEHVERKAA